MVDAFVEIEEEFHAIAERYADTDEVKARKGAAGLGASARGVLLPRGVADRHHGDVVGLLRRRVAALPRGRSPSSPSSRARFSRSTS